MDFTVNQDSVQPENRIGREREDATSEVEAQKQRFQASDSVDFGTTKIRRKKLFICRCNKTAVSVWLQRHISSDGDRVGILNHCNFKAVWIYRMVFCSIRKLTYIPFDRVKICYSRR